MGRLVQALGIQKILEDLDVPSLFLGVVPSEHDFRQLLRVGDLGLETLDDQGPLGDIVVVSLGARQTNVLMVPAAQELFWEGRLIDAGDLLSKKYMLVCYA